MASPKCVQWILKFYSRTDFSHHDEQDIQNSSIKNIKSKLWFFFSNFKSPNNKALKIFFLKLNGKCFEVTFEVSCIIMKDKKCWSGTNKQFQDKVTEIPLHLKLIPGPTPSYYNGELEARSEQSSWGGGEGGYIEELVFPKNGHFSITKCSSRFIKRWSNHGKPQHHRGSPLSLITRIWKFPNLKRS